MCFLAASQRTPVDTLVCREILTSLLDLLTLTWDFVSRSTIAATVAIYSLIFIQVVIGSNMIFTDSDAYCVQKVLIVHLIYRSTKAQ